MTASIAGLRAFPLEDGGNPRGADGIRVVDGGFLITPFSEDGDANYKFRLDVGLLNETPRPVEARFAVEWGDAEYARFRRYLLLTAPAGGAGVDEVWTKLPAEVDGTRATANIVVPPGAGHLGMHPPYNFGRFAALAASLPPETFRVGAIGRSLRGRELVAIEAGPAESRPLVVMARVHPYESVGSFLVEGMLRWLAAGSPESAELLARRRLAFLPMPNPDGVAEGLCKRTVGGLNLNEAAGSAEPEGVALTRYFRELRPLATFDIHGFMHDSDGFGTSDIARGRAIHAELLASPGIFDKKLRVSESHEPEGGAANLGCLAQNEFGSVRFGGSWAWYGRDAATLRRMGVAILRAYARQFEAEGPRT